MVDFFEPSNVGTDNPRLIDWVEEMVKLAKPDSVYWCDGSKEEYNELSSLMVKNGTLMPLNPEKRPGCYLAR